SVRSAEHVRDGATARSTAHTTPHTRRVRARARLKDRLRRPFSESMRSSFALPLVLSLITSLSTAAPKAPTTITRPTVVAGSAEPVGNLMRAGADGAEWAFPGGSTLIAEPGAELRVIAKPQDLDLGSKGQVPGYTVLLKQGFVRARVSDQAKSALVIAG